MEVNKTKILRLEKSGIPKIEIPVKLEELDEETIKYYLPFCLQALRRNAEKIKQLNAYVDGSYQEIKDITSGDYASGKADNRIIENHAYEIVQFKESFLLGDKKQFANKESVSNDDMTYLDKFLSEANYYTKDLNLRHSVYATGTGISFIMPRGDIFIETGEGKNKRIEYSPDYDAKVNSPFIYETIKSEENAVVYSSCIGESGVKDLFCFSCAEVWNKTTKKTEYVVTVYTREGIYEYRKTNGKNSFIRIADNYAYGELPMTEHSANETRISPVEVVYDLLNTINLLISLETNSVQDKVNQLLVFGNCDLEQTDIDSLYKNGLICLPPSGGGINPTVDTITNDLKYTETNVLVERVLTRAFDIVGVPLASAAVSSGNNEAAYLGGGWTNASTIIKRDILHFEQSDREELRKIIKICKLNPNNPLNETNANEIDIKYNVNQSNNLLVKTQSMQNLYDMKMPLLDILKAIPLFGDIHNVATRWQEKIDKAKAEEIANAEKTSLSANTQRTVAIEGEQATGDNLKGNQKAQQAQQTQAEQAKGV